MSQTSEQLPASLRVGVVIPTVQRTDALRRAVGAVVGQTVPPQAIAICAPEAAMIPTDVAANPMVIGCGGVKGASAQRNHALTQLPEDLDVIVFLDDDAVPREDYIEKSAACLQRMPDVVALTGRVVLDGVPRKRELGVSEMVSALEQSHQDSSEEVRDTDRLYGANMVVRADAARATPFDERLPLYSWLEDLDFSRRLAERGRLITYDGAVVVHQGSNSGGRTSHRRIGYSQVSNYLYLRHKGAVSTAEAVQLVGRPLVGTVVGSIRGDDVRNRRQRLVGMLLAACDAARGRITPERIVEL